MRPNDNNTRLFRATLGGGIGFLLGIVALFSFGVLGLAAPVIGLVIGVAVGATLLQREATSFLVGYLVTGITVFVIAQLVLNQRLQVPEDSTASRSIPFFAGMIANGSALIGGILAAAIAGHFGQAKSRSLSVNTISIAVPLVLLGLAIVVFSTAIAEDWLRSENGHAANRQQAIDAEKARTAEQEAKAGIPTQSGAFLYPNRLSIRGDDRQIIMATNDTVETVVQYYTTTLNARLAARTSATDPLQFWEGDFTYQGKPLHLCIARQDGRDETGRLHASIPYDVTQIFLTPQRRREAGARQSTVSR